MEELLSSSIQDKVTWHKELSLLRMEKGEEEVLLTKYDNKMKTRQREELKPIDLETRKGMKIYV